MRMSGLADWRMRDWGTHFSNKSLSDKLVKYSSEMSIKPFWTIEHPMSWSRPEKPPTDSRNQKKDYHCLKVQVWPYYSRTCQLIMNNVLYFLETIHRDWRISRYSPGGISSDLLAGFPSLTSSGSRLHLDATVVMYASTTTVAWGKPNPRKAVLDGKLVLQALPRHRKFGIEYAFSDFSTMNSITWIKTKM